MSIPADEILGKVITTLSAIASIITLWKKKKK